MATIINRTNTLIIDNRTFQKEDVTIAISGNSIVLQDFKEKLSIPYSEISYPTSNDLNDLFVILSGYLSQYNNSFPSINNVSDTALTAGTTYTGTGEMNNLDDVMLAVKTDQNGTLYADFSPDGINWDSTLSFIYDTTRINAPHILVKGSRYFRVRFINTSVSNQTYFRLNTYFGNFNKLTSSINSTISENYDSLSVRPTDYHYEVAMGKRQGRTMWNIWADNADIDVGTEVIRSYGGTFSLPTVASTWSFVSSSENDTALGTGARAIVVYYIDSNRTAQIGIVTLNGTTPVVTAFSGWGINRLSIYTAGSTGVNEGNITATNVTGGFINKQIPINAGTDQSSVFYIQTNHTALIDGGECSIVKASGGTAPIVTITGWVYSYVSSAYYKVFSKKVDTAITSEFVFHMGKPFPIGEKSIFWFEGTTDQNNTQISIRYSLIEERII